MWVQLLVVCVILVILVKNVIQNLIVIKTFGVFDCLTFVATCKLFQQWNKDAFSWRDKSVLLSLLKYTRVV
jgi:hypothetical protein